MFDEKRGLNQSKHMFLFNYEQKNIGPTFQMVHDSRMDCAFVACYRTDESLGSLT